MSAQHVRFGASLRLASASPAASSSNWVRTITSWLLITAVWAGVSSGQRDSEQIQFQNNGHSIMTSRRGVVVNCATGMNCSARNTTVNLESLGGSLTANNLWTAGNSYVGVALDVRTFGAKCDGVTDNWGAITTAQAALPVKIFGDQGIQYIGNGIPAHTGTLIFPAGICMISQTLAVSPFVNLTSTESLQTTIKLQDNIATSGPEYWVVDVKPVTTSSGTNPSPNQTYGVQFHNMTIDCNGGAIGPSGFGHNVVASGMRYYGAQGSDLGNLWIQNCGLRGFLVGGIAGNLSDVFSHGVLEVIYVTQGPGVDLQCSACTFDAIRAEQVNPNGTYTDGDGDPEPGILFDGAQTTFVSLIGTEYDTLPVKFTAVNDVGIGTEAVSPSPSCSAVSPPSPCTTTTGNIIANSSTQVSIGSMFTYAGCPGSPPCSVLLTNFLVNRVSGVTLPGNFKNYPSASYDSAFLTASLTTTAAASDTLSVPGMTSAGHCYLTPTNSGAAGGIASVYLSAKATDQITVNHAATAGWTFDVECKAQ